MGRAGLRALVQSCLACLQLAAGSGFLVVKERRWFNMLRHFERCLAIRVNRSPRAPAGGRKTALARR